MRTVGNLFGHYIKFFLLGALTKRTLFVDWTGSARPPARSSAGRDEEPPGRPRDNKHGCTPSRASGVACSRVRDRFDLGAHFGRGTGNAPVGRGSWQWTRQAVSRVEALGHREHVVQSIKADKYLGINCSRAVELLVSHAVGWVTLSLHHVDALVCFGAERRTDQLLFAGPMRAYASQLERERPTTSPVDGDDAAARARAVVRVLGRKALWSAGKSVQFARNDAIGRCKDVACTPESVSGCCVYDVGGRSTRYTGLGLLGRMVSCVMHVMLRPRLALQATLLPHVRAAGNRSVVGLHLRTGWAEQAKLFDGLLRGQLPSHSRKQWLMVVDALRGNDSALHTARAAGDLWGRASPIASARELMDARGESAALLRWAAIAQQATCQPQIKNDVRPPKTDGPSCFGPSPHWAAEARALGASRHAARLASWRAAAGPAVAVDGSARSAVAQTVECAARLAQSHSADRATSGRGGSEAAPGWAIHVMADSDGMKAVLERLPPLRGHVLLPAAAERGGEEKERSATTLRPVGRRLSDSFYVGMKQLSGTALATDIWWLGATDHVLPVSASTLTSFASRSVEAGGRPHLLTAYTTTVGNKVVPVCHELSCWAFGEDRNRAKTCPCDANVFRSGRVAAGGGSPMCDARRYALFSNAAGAAVRRAVPVFEAAGS